MKRSRHKTLLCETARLSPCTGSSSLPSTAPRQSLASCVFPRPSGGKSEEVGAGLVSPRNGHSMADDRTQNVLTGQYLSDIRDRLSTVVRVSSWRQEERGSWLFDPLFDASSRGHNS
jgi:hypothetical protein